jgi:hypothetical protein
MQQRVVENTHAQHSRPGPKTWPTTCSFDKIDARDPALVFCAVLMTHHDKNVLYYCYNSSSEVLYTH